MSDKYSRLPKWAQDEITQLRGMVSSRDESIAILSGARHTRVYVKDMERPNQWIESHSQVCFQTSSGEIYVNLDMDYNLRISSWIGAISIEPRASNCVEIGIKK